MNGFNHLHDSRLLHNPNALYVSFDAKFRYSNCDEELVKEKIEADKLWDAEFDALEDERLKEEQHYICSECFEISDLVELTDNEEQKPTCSCGCQEFMSLQ
ncbi:hypothetical protein [Vibrio sp. 10N.239.312.D08]|uniref:hypothetical protein n=1 Tax=Vibrio sp. 10N.239.312.D08 TaxID=3229978 RepID=UPI00354E21A1